MLDAMATAERSIELTAPAGPDRPPDGVPPLNPTTPLGQPLELDRLASGEREQAVERFEGVAGFISPLSL